MNFYLKLLRLFTVWW